MIEPTDLERSIMALLLAGEHRALEVLRRQCIACGGRTAISDEAAALAIR